MVNPIGWPYSWRLQGWSTYSGLDQEGFQDPRAFTAFTEVELSWSSSRKSPEHLAADTSCRPDLLVTGLIKERL